MSDSGKRSSRRQILKTFGVLGAVATVEGVACGEPAASASVPAAVGFREELGQKVEQTTIVDTHEHLPDEDERLHSHDDWGVLFSHYIDSDLVVAGMPIADLQRLISRKVDPLAKWPLLAPYWPVVKNTGYGRAVGIAMRELYGIDELDEKAIPVLQQRYEKLCQPGFYRKILVDMGRIESCQVNYLGGRPFKESHAAHALNAGHEHRRHAHRPGLEDHQQTDR